VIVERIDKRPSTGKRHREKNRLDETEHKVRSDLPPTNNFSSDISYTNHDPFNPEFCRQRKAAIDNMEYRRIIVSWKAKSLNEVVSLMKELSIGKSYIDRAWIVFYWVSQNIEYDVNSYFSGDIRHQTPDDVFRNRSGVCDAYGTIFKALCDGVQLENVKISGYAKGYGYIPGKTTFSRTNHAWNVVRLDKQWYLIDSTWGAGHIDRSNQYEKRLCPHYFLTRPEQMIYNHFPEDSRWQLLSSTVSMQQFIALPYVRPRFFELQLEIVSSRQTNMVTFDTERNLAEVLIRAPSNVDLSCSIAHGKTSGLAQYDASRKLWQCLFRPQTSGYQTLDIYARDVQSSKTYESAIEFGLDMSHVIRYEGFPLTYSNFSTNKCQIFEPLADKLRRGSQVTIHCRIPGARCVRLGFDGTLSSQEQTIINDIFKQQITVPKREIVVYVQFANSKKSHSYEGLFKYAVE
jgi:transglutaminase-like putative cysteine protease